MLKCYMGNRYGVDRISHHVIMVNILIVHKSLVFNGILCHIDQQYLQADYY